MNVNTVAPLVGSEQHDSQIAKRWAAEDFAVAIGLLRECPYHGRPVRVEQAQAGAKASLVDARSALQAFNGDRGELLATAQRIARSYSDTCSECEAAAEHELLD